MAITSQEIVEVDAEYPAQYAGGLPATQQGQQSGSAMGAIMQIAPMAMQNPRNESRALSKVLAAADDAWYWAIPNRGEGLSVKGARSAVRHYRNVGVVPYVEEIMVNQDGRMVGGWRMTVLAIDMENVVIETSSATCSKPTRKPNEKDLAYEQRCFQQQLAFLGRIERNAIFKILPGEWQEQIKGSIFAKRKLDPLPKRINELVERAKSLGVTVDQLKKVIGCAPLQMSEAQWADMWGRTNAIKNEGFSIADAFPELGLNEAADAPQAKGEAPAAELSELAQEAYKRIKDAGFTKSQGNATALKLFGKTVVNLESQSQVGAVISKLENSDFAS